LEIYRSTKWDVSVARHRAKKAAAFLIFSREKQEKREQGREAFFNGPANGVEPLVSNYTIPVDFVMDDSARRELTVPVGARVPR
jgi:hypothetical protein